MFIPICSVLLLVQILSQCNKYNMCIGTVLLILYLGFTELGVYYVHPLCITVPIHMLYTLGYIVCTLV